MNPKTSDSTAISAVARLDRLPQLMEDLDRCANDLGMPPALALRLQLVVEELFTNTIKHGHLPPDTTRIDVQLERLGCNWRLSYRDQGMPFDPFSAPCGSAQSGAIGGLGTALVQGLAGQCAYVREGNINRIDIVFSADLESSGAQTQCGKRSGIE